MIMNNRYLITILYPHFFLFNFILLKEIKQSYNHKIKKIRFFLICYIFILKKTTLNGDQGF